MHWFKRLRTRIHRLILNRNMLHNVQARKVVNLKDATNIGILFDASNLENVDLINEYSAKFRELGKRIELLAYYKSTKNTEKHEFPFFTSQEINWYYKPRGEKVKRFMSTKFDLLINASIEDCEPLDYIAAMSKARYRIGCYSPEKTSHYDLMISLKQERTLSHYMDQVNHYLQIIKT